MDRTTSSRPAWTAPSFAIWTGQALSLVGSTLAQFALIWWLTRQTGSAVVLTTASLLSLLPTVLLGPLAGACVDRWDRRLVMIVADSLVAMASLGLLVLSATGRLQIGHVYGLMFLRAVGNAFHWPAMQASTALMVPKGQLARVAGLNQGLRGATDIAAPPLGAFLVALLPLPAIMAIDVITAALAVVPLGLVRVPQPPRTAPEGERPHLGADLLAGLRYLWGWPGMMALCLMTMLLHFLITPAFALMPLLITRHLGGGVAELGWANSAQGVGFLAGGLILGAWGGFRRRLLTVLVGITGIGVGALAVGLAPASALGVVLAGLAVAGAMNAMTVGAAFALLQEVVAPEMHGRVLAIVISLSSAMMPLGMAVAGPFADAVSVRSWFTLAGVVQVITGLGALLVALNRRWDPVPQPATSQASSRR